MEGTPITALLGRTWSGLARDVATHRIEQLIRSYDPCISCATHFLDLSVENLS